MVVVGVGVLNLHLNRPTFEPRTGNARPLLPLVTCMILRIDTRDLFWLTWFFGLAKHSAGCGRASAILVSAQV